MKIIRFDDFVNCLGFCDELIKVRSRSLVDPSRYDMLIICNCCALRSNFFADLACYEVVSFHYSPGRYENYLCLDLVPVDDID
jgi:hypothetical protein